MTSLRPSFVGVISLNLSCFLGVEDIGFILAELSFPFSVFLRLSSLCFIEELEFVSLGSISTSLCCCSSFSFFITLVFSLLFRWLTTTGVVATTETAVKLPTNLSVCIFI